ncbi:MAG: alkaline phosphatase D family protein [Polyangiaceae bacterium]|nr:alkaline phosphatase D family protein [Polyangiaceae bacterium]
MPNQNDRAAFQTAFGAANSHPSGPLLSGPLLGNVSETAAQFWVQAAAPTPLTLTVKGPNGSQSTTLAPKTENWLTLSFQVSGLAPNSTHSYFLTGEFGTTPTYTFRTAPSQTARSLKIAFGSCFYYYKERQPIFEAVRQSNPALWVMAGDNCYYDPPDWENEHTKMLAQLRNRNNAQIQPLVAQTPTLAVWDDHDFGPNDSDGTYPQKAESLRVFRRMWAQPPGGLPAAEGIFFSKRLGPCELFFLDMRYHRRKKQQILGKAQYNWLCDALKNSNAPFKLVVSGSQVLPSAPAAKGWECFHLDGPSEVNSLVSFIHQHDIRGVVFASGDVHLAYLLRQRGKPLGNGIVSADLWELTSSPLANDIWNPTLLQTGEYDPTILREIERTNFGIIDIDLDRTGRELILSLVAEGGAPILQRSIAQSRLAPHVPREKWVALTWAPDAVYFFKGDKYLRFKPDAAHPDPGYPFPIEKYWSGVYPSDIQAAVRFPNEKAYFFQDNGYIAYNIAHDKAEPGPRYIGRYWKGLWTDGVDAAVVWNNGKAYFFKGSQYVRFDIAKDAVDPGYPKEISAGWPGVWPSGIDSVTLWPDGSAYFFRGDEHIRYNVTADKAMPGYPKKNSERWPGLTPAIA